MNTKVRCVLCQIGECNKCWGRYAAPVSDCPKWVVRCAVVKKNVRVASGLNKKDACALWETTKTRANGMFAVLVRK